jgi:RNA-directed DNA polymerase
LQRWANRRKTNPKQWWQTHGQRERFMTQERIMLAFNTDANSSINWYTKVQGNRSPYDGDFKYWSERLGRYPGLSIAQIRLLGKQKFKCNLCKEYFQYKDIMEIDHIIPLSRGGKRDSTNLQLLHRHCHDVKTNSDLSKTGLPRKTLP